MADRGEDVGIFNEPQLRKARVLLPLPFESVGDAPVGDGRDADEEVVGTAVEFPFDGAQHFARRRHGENPHPRRALHRHGPGDDGHVGAEIARGARESEALSTRRAVRDAAHVVDRLVGGPDRHENAPTREGLFRKEPGKEVENVGGLRHAAFAHVAAGLKA